MIRQLLALLDDEDADALDALDAYFAELDEAGRKRLAREADAIDDVGQRVLWVRGLIHAAQEAPKRTSEKGPAAIPDVPAEIPGVPGELMPILAQLSPDELQLGAQMVSVLDVATTRKLAALLCRQTKRSR